jgi:hypothetical protein
MVLKSDTARKTAARLAALAEETDNKEERELFVRIRDAWITLANRCECFTISDVTDGQNAGGITASPCIRDVD